MKGWNNTRLKNLLNEPLLYGLNVSSEYEDRDMPRYIRITDFDDFNNLNEQTFKSLPEEIAQSAQLKDGDLLFARSGASVGKTFLYRPLPNGACYAGYLIRARFDRQIVLPEYVSYYTKSQSYENWKNATYIQATIQNISAERYYQLPISIPPLEEQGRIVSYLNDKTGKIDARVSLLSKKRDAYQRLKKALISRVVTKGLNPNAKFKPSGVDWIGEIPEGWEVKRMKDICILSPSVIECNQEAEASYLPMEGLRLGRIETINERVSFLRGKYVPFENGDLLIAKVTPCFENDNIAIAENLTNGIGYGSSEIFVLRTKENIYNRYLFYISLSIPFQSKACSTMCGVGGLKRISPQFMKSHTVGVPPLPEQQSIATYLDEKCSEIDANIANLEKQIEKYKELKRALISEVVTGKRMV
ncbi:MAG: restriction endonuclease subunit S [Agathobacter sp.]